MTSIAAGIQRYLQNDCDRRDVFIFKKDDPNFKLFRDALDSRRKELFASGVGAVKVQADPVTAKEEMILWDKGIITPETSQGLSYLVYYYNCKLFGFRARDEHAELMAEQFRVYMDGSRKCLEYRGRLAKNVTGNFDCKSTPRVVKQYADPSNPRCVVSIYEKYLNLIPATGRFYRRPLNNTGTISFSSQHVGINKLCKYLPDMFAAAKIDVSNRRITGHSGKVTCCTTLYGANLDEKSIKTRSGHRSDAVRLYTRPSEQLSQDISDALQPPKPVNNSPGVKTRSSTNVMKLSNSKSSPKSSEKHSGSNLEICPLHPKVGKYVSNSGSSDECGVISKSTNSDISNCISNSSNLSKLSNSQSVFVSKCESDFKPKLSPKCENSDTKPVNRNEILEINVPHCIRKIVVCRDGCKMSLEL